MTACIPGTIGASNGTLLLAVTTLHDLAGAEQASALEGNPQEHQWLVASRAGCQALPANAIITRLLLGKPASLTTNTAVPEDSMHVMMCFARI